MSENLEIVISAKDKASGPLRGIGDALGGVGKIAGGLLVGGAVAATGAVIGLTAALSDCVSEAMASESAQAQLNAVLQSTGGVAGVTAEAANDLANSLSKITEFEDDAILETENLLLTFTNIGKDVFPDVTAMALDMSKALGQDLKSSAMQLGKALQDPVAGASALRRVGVKLTDAQEEQIKALMGVSKEYEELTKNADKAQAALPGLTDKLNVARLKLNEMTASGKASGSQMAAQNATIAELERKISGANEDIRAFNQYEKQSVDIVAAQNIIMSELKTEFGGVAEAAGKTAAGQIAIMNNAVGNLKEEIGGAFIPVLTTMAGEFTKLVTTYGPGVAAFFTELAPKIQTGMTALSTAFQSGGLSGVGALLQTEIGGLWSTYIAPEITTWPAKFWDWLTNPETGVIANATEQLNLVPLTIQTWAASVDFKAIGASIGNSIVLGVTDVMKSDQTGSSVVGAFLESLGKAILSIDKELFKAGQELAMGLGDSLTQNIESDWFREMLMSALQSVAASLSPLSILGPIVLAAQNAGMSIPGFAEGGIVPGPIGAPQLAIVHGGEEVIPPGKQQTSRQDVYNLTVNNYAGGFDVANQFYMLRARSRA